MSGTDHKKRLFRIKFEPRDLWLGAYYDTATNRVFICVVPFFPMVYEPGPGLPPTAPRIVYLLPVLVVALLLLVVGLVVGAGDTWAWVIGFGGVAVGIWALTLSILAEGERQESSR